jgi:Domain of unknown function (DUF4037)
VSTALPEFMPGQQLGELFYREAVRPILDRRFPGLPHSAGLLGTGSDALGFDTPRSMDHHWGPRVQLFVTEDRFSQRFAAELHHLLAHELPFDVHGFSTHFHEANPATHTVFMAPTSRRPVNHMVFVTTTRRFLRGYLGVDPLDHALSPAEWLSIPEQLVRTVTTGAVYHDATGELARVRQSLQWYPHDVWLYILAAQWRRIEQEEPFVGRAAEAGDELGSQVLAARLVRELMHLCLLMARQYAPYSKWLGTAFSRLSCAAELTPSLSGACTAASYAEREAHLAAAYRHVAALHNALGLTEPLPTEPSYFFERPFLVIHADRFAEVLRAAITDPAVKSLPLNVGSLSQWADSTDILSDPNWFERLRRCVYTTTPA